MEQLNDLMINPEIREASTDKSRDNPRKSFWKSLMVDIAASLSLFSNKIRRQFLSSAPVMYIVKQNYEPSWNVFTCLYRNMICRRIFELWICKKRKYGFCFLSCNWLHMTVSFKSGEMSGNLALQSCIDLEGWRPLLIFGNLKQWRNHLSN